MDLHHAVGLWRSCKPDNILCTEAVFCMSLQCELREKLSVLDGKIERTDTVMFKMDDMRSKLMVSLLHFIKTVSLDSGRELHI